VIAVRRPARLVCLTALLSFLMVPSVHAEWYAAGYGGMSLEGMLRNVGMPTLGDARARAIAASPTGPFSLGGPGNVNNPLNTIDQKMDVSDLKLKDSPMFGGKVGYFLNDYGYRWLGVELEAFTTQPNVKQQTFQTSQTALFAGPGTGGTPIQCGPTATNPASCGGPTIANGSVEEAKLRVITVAANLVLRYPGRFLEPYAGLGAGVFHFRGSAPLNGTTTVPGLNVLAGVKWYATEHFNVFLEYKYNRATIDGLGTSFGLGADYQVTHVVGGIGWHF
jgi:opacity protein-like surface antigen